MIELHSRPRRICVTGAAGFIGSHLVDALLDQGIEVVGLDNFSSGQRRFLEQALRHPGFSLVEGDTLDDRVLHAAFSGCDTVAHFAANADVRFGLQAPRRDLEQNTIATFHVLEAARQSGVQRILFSSTGSVYGESAVIPTPEDAPFPIQTSLYGASKLAGEGMIQAYCEGFGLEGYIFRFVSILGERYSHGHVFDFCRQLLADSSRLTVLGNGHQRKSYLYVQDCIAAILCVLASEPARSAPHRVCTFNLGVDSFCEVRDSIGWITDTMGVSPELSFGTEARGWVGDNPLIHLDTKRIRALGWSPQLSIEQAVRKTTSWLLQNRWIFDQRQ